MIILHLLGNHFKYEHRYKLRPIGVPALQRCHYQEILASPWESCQQRAGRDLVFQAS